MQEDLGRRLLGGPSIPIPGRKLKKVIKVKKVKKVITVKKVIKVKKMGCGPCGRPQEGLGRLLGGPSTPLPGRKFKKVIKVIKVKKVKKVIKVIKVGLAGGPRKAWGGSWEALASLYPATRTETQGLGRLL